MIWSSLKCFVSFIPNWPLVSGHLLVRILYVSNWRFDLEFCQLEDYTFEESNQQSQLFSNQVLISLMFSLKFSTILECNPQNS